MAKRPHPTGRRACWQGKKLPPSLRHREPHDGVGQQQAGCSRSSSRPCTDVGQASLRRAGRPHERLVQQDVQHVHGAIAVEVVAGVVGPA